MDRAVSILPANPTPEQARAWFNSLDCVDARKPMVESPRFEIVTRQILEAERRMHFGKMPPLMGIMDEADEEDAQDNDIRLRNYY